MPHTLTLLVPKGKGDLSLRYKAPDPEVASREANASLEELAGAMPSGRSGVLDMRLAVLVDALDVVLMDVEDDLSLPMGSSFTEAATALGLDPKDELAAVLQILSPLDVADHVSAIDEWVKEGTPNG